MRPSFIPIPIFLILIAVLYLLPVPQPVFEPRWLLPVLNIIFVFHSVYQGSLKFLLRGHISISSSQGISPNEIRFIIFEYVPLLMPGTF